MLLGPAADVVTSNPPRLERLEEGLEVQGAGCEDAEAEDRLCAEGDGPEVEAWVGGEAEACPEDHFGDGGGDDP